MTRTQWLSSLALAGTLAAILIPDSPSPRDLAVVLFAAGASMALSAMHFLNKGARVQSPPVAGTDPPAGEST